MAAKELMWLGGRPIYRRQIGPDGSPSCQKRSIRP